MKMTKLFITVFDEELRSRGFKRKAKLYYRLNGDILQGVVIKTINPYNIHFYSAPYWMENIQAELSPLHKGYWAESGFCIAPEVDAYYREENEQFNLDYMNACFTLAKEHILPVLDRMNDLDSYIELCIPNWSTLDDEKAKQDFIKIKLSDIDRKYSCIDSQIKMFWRVWNGLYTYSAFLHYGCLKGDLKIGYDLLEKQSAFLPFHTNSNRSAQNNYIKFMTDDGIVKAKAYFEERRSIMLPRLRDELGLDTFDL